MPDTAAMPLVLSEGDSAQYDASIQAALADSSLVVPQASEWVNWQVKKGDTLSTIFGAQGLPSDEWIALLKLGGDVMELKRLKAGEELQIRKDGDQLQELRYALDEMRTLNVRRVDDQFEAVTITAELERRQEKATGSITSSLFADGNKAGLSDRMVMEMAEIFGYDVDFALDLRQGDRFSVVYEKLYKDGKSLRYGDILAAEFVNQGKAYRAVRHVGADGRVAYYTPAGESLRKAFIRTPLDVIRISSPFNLARRHPILNTIRAHKGVDYAAAAGTPIKAVGDAKVTFVGNKNGFGRVVVLQHGNQYETLYAHMSRFAPGISAGQRVSQGRVIGYVGMSGLATAPHLHYEFHIGGKVVNPVTVAMPRANPIDRKELAQFKSETAVYLAALDSDGTQQTAQAQTQKAIGGPATTAPTAAAITTAR
ncbi:MULTISPECIES: OapA family protein [Hydrocarboniphaga]|jgi:murein DD-endopeptidase MepM/ murein hydrolase activator NlpD|uniref:M23 peptidase domain protein n=1 Tax=Hydrocarboniphaga effusa AP103 TaxID=1172194 RepID=I8I544_9GAMM|nr:MULTISPECIES: peptidoglycan DD-metalloendopeptidase family protein [Hydrocarboniphaga]EIT71431.1 M23 peptidase domain protein [Hydrocarboniphaga effusa AP103]MDZ4079336.1 peptidoglycan DD-metalloendopeptidase family protein [Hydrocarboniphaga sp.]